MQTLNDQGSGCNYELLIFDIEELFEFVERYLMDDWVFVVGDSEALTMLEYTLYTPNSKKNDGFLLAMIPIKMGITSFALVKKNEELRKFIRLGIEDFSMLLAFQIYLNPSKSCLIEGTFVHKEANRQEKVKKYANALRKNYKVIIGERGGCLI